MRQATGAAGAVATITLPAGTAAQQRVLDAVYWSYSAAPTGGRLTIASTGQPSFDVDVFAAGPGSVVLTNPFRGMPGQTVVVTLAAPGGAVVGKVTIPNDWLE